MQPIAQPCLPIYRSTDSHILRASSSDAGGVKYRHRVRNAILLLVTIRRLTWYTCHLSNAALLSTPLLVHCGLGFASHSLQLTQKNKPGIPTHLDFFRKPFGLQLSPRRWIQCLLFSLLLVYRLINHSDAIFDELSATLPVRCPTSDLKYKQRK